MTRGASIGLHGIRKTYGSFTAIHDLNLRIEPGEFFAFVGPSGSGKTTSLRVIAGLEPVDGGQVLIGGDDVTGASPGDRDIAMVFQNYALYPHMTVAQNIAFPLKMVKTPAEEIATRVRQAAEQVQMGHLLDRRPGQLSGGQQQRVALARAIVRQPTVFLLDEPLSNLDAQLRLETRVGLKKLQLDLGVTAVYVTHDQEEAFTLADRMAIFMDGEVVQVGPPQELFDRPDDVRVAAFLGRPPMNLVPGTLSPDGVRIDGWDSDPLPLPETASDSAAGSGDGRAVTVGFRPRDLQLGAAGARAEVYLAEVMGEHSIVNVQCGEHVVKATTADTAPRRVGEEVFLSVDPADVHLFDRETGRRLDTSTAVAPASADV